MLFGKYSLFMLIGLGKEMVHLRLLVKIFITKITFNKLATKHDPARRTIFTSAQKCKLNVCKTAYAKRAKEILPFAFVYTSSVGISAYLKNTF